MKTLLDCILAAAIFLSPLFHFMYCQFMILFDTVSEWIKGDNGHS